VLGAEFSPRQWVGSPAARRIALSCLSLRVAGKDRISASLGAVLGGSWISVFMYRRPLMVVLDHLLQYGTMDLSSTFTLPRRTANELVLAAVLAPVAVTDLRVPIAPKIWALDASPTKGA
jgi:hypothetical protein